MVIIENFATSDEVAKLLLTAQSVKWGEFNPNNFWKNRIYDSLKDKERSTLTQSLLIRIQKAIINNSSYNEIYPDCCNIVRWEAGYEMQPHADAENPDGSNHEMYWRKFGCVLYLNNDFDGGSIYFPNKDIELKPKPGTLVFFPGTLEWLHGVKETKNGIRYNFATFWTDNKTRSIL